MDCTFSLTDNPVINKIIEELANNNLEYARDLANIYKSDNFKKYVINHTKNDTEIDANKYKKLLKDYYDNNFIDPSKFIPESNNNSFGFTNMKVANLARDYFASYVSYVNQMHLYEANAKANDINALIKLFQVNVKRKLEKRFNKLELTEREIKIMDAAIQKDINNSTTEYSIEAMCTIIKDRDDYRNSNFVDLYYASLKPEFYEFAKTHSKISDLFKNTSTQDLNDTIEDTDEDTIDGAYEALEEISGTGQWNFGDNIKNSNDLVSAVVKQRINALKKLSSPVKVDGKWQEDTSNDLGVAEAMSYQKVSKELFYMSQNTSAKNSVEDFMRELYKLAVTKKAYHGLMQLWEEAGGAKPNDFANKLFVDFTKNITNNIQLVIDKKGEVVVRQSNERNNARLVLYYNLYNDLKITARVANIVNVADNKSNIKKYKDDYNDLMYMLGKKFDNELINLVNEIANDYKIYLPDIDPSIFYKAVTDTKSRDKILFNVYQLISYLEDLQDIVVRSNENYRRDKHANAKLYGKYQEERRKYIEQDGNELAVEPKAPNYIKNDQFLNNNKVMSFLDRFTNHIVDYVDVDFELNSITVEGKQVSDVMYNNFFYQVLNDLADKSTIKIFCNDRMRSDEYKFSNIFVDHGFNRGLFKLNGRAYVPTDYATGLLRGYKMDGIKNEVTGENAKYTNMSNNDYFYFSYMAFKNRLMSYRKYNETDDYDDGKTTLYMTRIAADAPKQFMMEAPVYSIDELLGYDSEVLGKRMDDIIKTLTKAFQGDTKFKSRISSKLYNVTDDANKFIKQVIALRDVNNDQEYTELADDLVPTVDGERYKTVYAIGKKVYKVFTLKQNGNIIARAVFSATVNGIVVNGTKTKVTYNDVNFEGFYTNNVDNFTLDDSVLDAIRTDERKKYIDEIYKGSSINHKSSIFRQLKNIVYGEIQMALKAKLAMFGQNGAKLIIDPNQLYNDAIIKKGKYEDNGKLIGNLFEFNKLPSIHIGNGKYYHFGDFVYGEHGTLNDIIDISSTGGLSIENGQTNIKTIVGKDNAIDYRLDTLQESALEAAIENYIRLYNEHLIKQEFDKYNAIYKNLDYNTLYSMYINYLLFNNNFDDLFTGNNKFYKDSKTSVKRAKEYIAGGTAYAGRNKRVNDNNHNPYDPDTTELEEIIDNNGNTISYISNGIAKTLKTRTGYRGMTINNVVRPVNGRNTLKESMERIFTKNGKVDTAKVDRFMKPYESITTDDAQSYTTIYEYIRRIKLLGEYEKYKKLITQLIDSTPVEEIDSKEFNTFIQLAKNYYYDHKYDTVFGMHIPRQIKNAEFVLIPKFIKGTQFEDLCQFMLDNDIDQVNTVEASKAANNNVVTLWNNNNEMVDTNSAEFQHQINLPGAVANFNYSYLYRQQEVAQHIKDEQNKAGIQIMKKIIDNIANNPSLGKHYRQFVDNYVANIEESFNSLCKELNIKFNDDGSITSIDGSPLNFSKFNSLGLEQLQKLGVDRNTYDYFTEVVVESGSVDTIMPDCMNIIGKKLENIVMSIFTNNIARQKLPGWHGAQVSDVGFRQKLKVNKDENGNENEEINNLAKTLRYHPDGKNYIEVMLPRWAAKLYGINEQDIVDSDISTMIGYRIPTEGKQSIGIFKVVGILPDAYGSTIVVPDGWVAQTGADFDIDSIYGITYEFYKDKKGKLCKYELNLHDDEQSTRKRYNKYIFNEGRKAIERDLNLNKDKNKQVTLKDYLKVINDIEKDAIVDKFQSEKIELYTKENKIYKHLETKLPNTAKKVKNIINNKNEKYNVRIDKLINFLENNHKNRKSLLDLLDIYRELKNNYDAFIEELYGINNIVNDKLEELAKSVGLESFEEFSKRPILLQNDKRARNNAILDAAINILQHDSNFEEMMVTSHFKDMIAAKEEIDKLVGANTAEHNIYSFDQQLWFRNNAMGGAILKAISFLRDTYTSINNVVGTLLSKPIKVKYISKADNERFGIDYDAASEFIDRDGDIFIHKGLGHGKRLGAGKYSNRNIVGEILTSYSSQTSAHAFDAVKEGAIPNENILTFNVYKTLIDAGLDHYHAMLWLRQPAITALIASYDKTNSVFEKFYSNAINNGIRQLSKSLKAGRKPLTVKGKPIDDYTPINDIYKAINAVFAIDFSKSKDDISLDFYDITELYSKAIDADNNTILKNLQQMVVFKELNNIGQTLFSHSRVLSADKYGATENFFNNRSKLYTIYDIFDKQKEFDLYVDNGTNKISLLEAVLPGIENIFMTENADGEKELISLDNIDSIVAKTITELDIKRSYYPTLAAFFKYCLLPAYAISSNRFITESSDYVHGIMFLSNFLQGSLNETTYNDFKKYVQTYIYKNYPISITNEILINRDPDTGKLSIVEDIAHDTDIDRIYGYVSNDDIDTSELNLANLTDEQYELFHKLTPATKIALIQNVIRSSSNNIFNYIKVNLDSNFNRETIRYNDQNENLDYIYQLFNEALHSENRAVVDTLVDIIKYSFIVEGNEFRRGNISKIIPNNALYESYENRGLDIVNPIKEEIIYTNVDSIADNNLYEDYLRGHFNTPGLPKYSVKYIYKQSELSSRTSKTGIITFDLSSDADVNKLKAMNVFNDKNKRVMNYILIKNRGEQTLHYVHTNPRSQMVYMFPLNPLEKYEYDTSRNIENDKFITKDQYLDIISKIEDM